MFDNLGLAEFLMLATLALLFFGPERLPQLAATAGRWLARLTQYSRAFMNQWSEEALVVHDALDQVRIMRDEILAARAEIAGSLDTARQDVDETIREARTTLNAARPTFDLEAEPPPAIPATVPSKDTPPGRSGNDTAIARTQQILDAQRARLPQAKPPTPGTEAITAVAHGRPPPPMSRDALHKVEQIHSQLARLEQELYDIQHELSALQQKASSPPTADAGEAARARQHVVKTSEASLPPADTIALEEPA